MAVFGGLSRRLSVVGSGKVVFCPKTLTCQGFGAFLFAYNLSLFKSKQLKIRVQNVYMKGFELLTCQLAESQMLLLPAQAFDFSMFDEDAADYRMLCKNQHPV